MYSLIQIFYERSNEVHGALKEELETLGNKNALNRRVEEILANLGRCEWVVKKIGRIAYTLLGSI